MLSRLIVVVFCFDNFSNILFYFFYRVTPEVARPVRSPEVLHPGRRRLFLLSRLIVVVFCFDNFSNILFYILKKNRVTPEVAGPGEVSGGDPSGSGRRPLTVSRSLWRCSESSELWEVARSQSEGPEVATHHW